MYAFLKNPEAAVRWDSAKWNVLAAGQEGYSPETSRAGEQQQFTTFLIYIFFLKYFVDNL